MFTAVGEGGTGSSISEDGPAGIWAGTGGGGSELLEIGIVSPFCSVAVLCVLGFSCCMVVDGCRENLRLKGTAGVIKGREVLRLPDVVVIVSGVFGGSVAGGGEGRVTGGCAGRSRSFAAFLLDRYSPALTDCNSAVSS